MSKLKRLVSSPNPPTLSGLVKKLKMLLTTIWPIINKKLNIKLIKKRRDHTLSLDSNMKRAKPSWKLYLLLNNHKWKKYIIVVDREKFSMSAEVKVSLQEYLITINRVSLRESWFGQVFRLKERPNFTLFNLMHINAQYYIQNILTTFISKDAKQLYPNGDFILYQNTAPSHAAKTTINFLMDKGIKFITLEQWMPMSPDASPMDYFVWRYIKEK